MSKAPTEKHQPAKSSRATSDPLAVNPRNLRRATIVGPPSKASTSSLSSCSSKGAVTPAKRILRKNTSTIMASDEISSLEHARMRSGSSGRVHFPDNQVTPEHAGEIVVQLSPDELHADAHLGFLQDGRRYAVNLCVPRYLGDNVTVVRSNAHLHLKEIRTNAEKTGHEFVLELEAYHDKLVNEEIALTSGSGEFVLSVSARVLGKGKGTPMLKRGIRCIAVDQGDSEMSDASTPNRHGDRSSPEKYAGASSVATRRASAGGAAALLKQSR